MCSGRRGAVRHPPGRERQFRRQAEDAVGAEPPRWTKDQPFDGHNLILNPHFSLKDPERGEND